MLHGTGHWPEEGIFMYAAISMDLKLFLISKMFFVYCFFFFFRERKCDSKASSVFSPPPR